MTRRRPLLALAISLIGVPLALSAAQSQKSSSGKTVNKWVDSQGITHYGDAVPPEYSQQGHAELNAQGVPLRTFPRQLTPEESDKAQQAAADEARRRQHDTFLLTTYTKVSDIEQLRDERIALIDGQMEIARGSIATSEQRLGDLEKRVRGFRPYSANANARRMPDQLAVEVVQTLKERDSLRDALSSREKEKVEQRTQFDADIARYRELTDKRRSP